MSKEIKTIQSPNKKEFDKLINQYLKGGWNLIEGSYSVLDGGVYSQVVECDGNNYYHIEYIDDDENGQIVEEGNYKDGKMDGNWVWYYENGQILEEGYYKEGKLDDTSVDYYDNGQIRSRKNYKDGELVGKFTKYYENGQIQYEGNYKDGKEDGKYTWYDKNGQKSKSNEMKKSKSNEQIFTEFVETLKKEDLMKEMKKKGYSKTKEQIFNKLLKP